MKCTNKLIGIVIMIFMASVFSACGEPEIKMPFSVFFNSTGNAYAEISMDIATLDSFASDFAVLSRDEVFDYYIENAGAGLLIDINNSECLYAQNAFDIKYPASITKILTALVTVENAELNEMIVCSSNVSNLGVSDAVALGLKYGDSFTVDQALRLMLLSSYNDVAVAIAEHVGGSVEHFCEMMNDKAKSLGATSTHFTNPHGLPDDEHYTSAYDLYLIFNEAIKNPVILEIIQFKEYKTTYKDINGNEKQASSFNTNAFFKGDYELPENIAIVGGKTGTTDEAGRCLMLLVRDNYANPYIAIILAENTRDNLYNDMSLLLSEIIN